MVDVRVGDKQEEVEAITAMLEAARDAKLNHDEASANEAAASKYETQCLNLLNRAQKEVDEWYAKQRKDAAHDSDWARAARKENSHDGT